MKLSTSLVAYWTITRRELVRLFRIWKQTFLPPVIMQSLYFLVFGAFIGSQIAPIHGVRYMAYIVPGLIMMAIINSSFMNVVFSFFSAKFQRSIEELLMAPVTGRVMLAGYVSGGVLRGLITGVLVACVSVLFARPPLVHPFAIVFFAVITAVVFALGGFLNALFAKTFDDAGLFTTFVLTPLTYLGGVFYSIDRLPPFFRAVSHANPIVYMVDGFRYGFFGFSDTNPLIGAAILLATATILIVVNLRLLKSGYGLRT